MEHAPTSSACTGSSSASGATWSTRTPASSTCRPTPADDETRRLLHRTIDAVRADMGTLEFNTAIAAAVRAEQPPHAGGRGAGERAAQKSVQRDGADARAAHAARRRGAVGSARVTTSTIAFETFPVADPALLVDDEVEIPVQVNGKVRGPGPRRGRRRRHRARSRGACRRARSPRCSTVPPCARSSSCPAGSSTSSSAERPAKSPFHRAGRGW